MKKWFGYILKTFAWVLGIFFMVVLFFNIQSSLRESKTRHEAAPATGKFVQAGDVEIFIQEMGPADGQVILFVHGTAAWSGLWRETMTPLAAAGYRCIAIDVPPFGFSERPAAPSYGNSDQANRIVALMDALEVEHAILYIHSIGGGAGMETALTIPERIDALVLLDVGGLNLNLQPPPEIQRSSALEIFLSMQAVRDPLLAATATNPLFTKTMISSMLLDPADATDDKIKILQKPLVVRNATRILGEWLHYVLTTQETSLTSDPENYQSLNMPALIVWGDSDTVIPIKDGEYLNSLLKNSEFVVMQGVNHVPHLEDLEPLTKIVLDFLGKLK